MRLLWLPSVLRAAGLTVHEYPGWAERGASTWDPRGIVCHATAGSRTSTDAGELRTIAITGSTSAPAPISQLYLSRSGAWWVVASGRCNHVLRGKVGSPFAGLGNGSLVGVEAQNDNRGEPWSPSMVDSYTRGVAAICRRMGWPVSRVVAHREHQTGKTDPAGVDMASFRARVAALLGTTMGEDDVTAQEVWDYRIGSPSLGIAPRAASDWMKELAYIVGDTRALRAETAALRAVVQTLADAVHAGGGSVDTAAILAGVDERLGVLRASLPDALADEIAGRVAE